MCDVYYQGYISPEDILLFYEEQYYAQGVHWLTRLNRVRVCLRARAVTRKVRKGSALDIGCGRGELLCELKRSGWQVLGIDWNAANAEAVSHHLKIPVIGGPDAIHHLPRGSFQLVSMLHVLEHDQAPAQMLQHAYAALQPGGRLVIGVPNAASLARRVFHRFWAGYDLPRHRWVFTPRSLTTLVEGAGFKVERMTGRLSDEWFDAYRSCRLACVCSGISSRIVPALGTLLLAVPLSLSSFFGFGSVMYLYALKP